MLLQHVEHCYQALVSARVEAVARRAGRDGADAVLGRWVGRAARVHVRKGEHRAAPRHDLHSDLREEGLARVGVAVGEVEDERVALGTRPRSRIAGRTIPGRIGRSFALI